MSIKKLTQTEIDNIRNRGYDLPAKNYWIRLPDSRHPNITIMVMRTKDLLEQLGFKWGTKDENELHELDLILRENELDWTNGIEIKK